MSEKVIFGDKDQCLKRTQMGSAMMNRCTVEITKETECEKISYTASLVGKRIAEVSNKLFDITKQFTFRKSQAFLFINIHTTNIDSL